MNWDQCVGQYGERIYRAAYRVLHHSGDAEDVTQEVLLEAYQKHSRANRCPDAALLSRMATLRAIDRLRRRHAAESIEDQFCAASTPSPPAALEIQEQVKLIRQEIARLPNREAQCFLLRYVEGLGNKEIAELLNAEPSAVSTAIHKARKKLQLALQNHSPGGVTHAKA